MYVLKKKFCYIVPLRRDLVVMPASQRKGGREGRREGRSQTSLLTQVGIGGS